MRTILLALILLLAPVAIAQPLGEQPGSTDVRFESTLANGAYQCGSGTLCGRSRRGTVAITNHHVIEGSDVVYVIALGHKYRSKVLDSNEHHDIALVEVPAKLPYVELGTDAPLREPLHYRAFDCGVHFRTWWAHPSQTYSVGGNSGGGVYYKGRLVGVIWGNSGDRIAFTPVSNVRRMIDAQLVTE